MCDYHAVIFVREIIDLIQDGRRCIRPRIRNRMAHVALGVASIVVLPRGHRCARDTNLYKEIINPEGRYNIVLVMLNPSANLEKFPVAGHGLERQVPAVAPPMYANARSVDAIVNRREMLDPGDAVGNLKCALTIRCKLSVIVPAMIY